MSRDEPLILAFETALRKMSISILRGRSELAWWSGAAQISSSEFLLEKIAFLLKENRLSPTDLEVVAVSAGPGSFTGIRVGLATAKALAYGLGQTCCGVSVLEALALMNVNLEPKRLLTVIPAGRNQIYWQAFVADCENSLKFSAENDPQNTSIAEFAAITDFSQNMWIIAEEAAANEIKNYLPAEHRHKVQIASDNVSKFVGLKCLEMIESKSITFKSAENLKPLYIREVRIGN